MGTLKRFSTVLLALLAGLAASNALAQPVPLDGRWVTPEEAAAARANAASSSSAPVPTYGTASTSTLSIGACEVTLRDSSHTYVASNCARVEPVTNGVPASVGFPVHLPTGALITSVTMYFFDNDPSPGADISAGLHRIDSVGTPSLIQGLFSGGSVTGGNNTFTGTLATPHPVNNTAGSYAILVILNKSATTLQAVYGFEVHYMLQVSPAPATATFLDVPVGHPLHRFVEALVAAGITAGCGAGNFCPTTPVTRGQMAVFLSVALGLHFPN